MCTYLSCLVICVKLIWCSFVGKIFAGKSSKEFDASPLIITASEKVLVPGSQSDDPAAVTDQLETPETVSEDIEVCDIPV